VELPERLIQLYTFENDLVLDPFMGSGSTMVAAAQLNRRYVGYDLDTSNVDIAEKRVRALRVRPVPAPEKSRKRIEPPNEELVDDFQSRATREGKAAQRLAEEVLTDAGFKITERNHRIPKTGVTVNFVARDAAEETWFFDVSGAFTSHRGGLLRTDTVWKSLGRANALKGGSKNVPIVFLTSHLPQRPSEGDTALRAAGPTAFFDAVEMLSDEGRTRLEKYAKGGFVHDGIVEPALTGFWTEADLEPHDS
jgi:site-specific DNA-methyltransferase (adenine-specific)